MASDAAAAAGAGQVEMEVAWHLLSVLIRLGRPAAASDLAAAAAAAAPSVSRHFVERMCRIPGSPLRISDGGVVTVSEMAVLAFLRFLGWDVPAPRVSLRPSGVRRWWAEVPITYERKRRASDAECLGGKRRRLPPPDADWVEHKQQKSHQLIAQSCAPAATREVHLKVIQELQDRLPTLGTFVGEPSLQFSTGFSLFPWVARISMPCLQLNIDQSLRGNDATVIQNMASAQVLAELTDSPCTDLPSVDAETNSIHDDKICRVSESEPVPTSITVLVEENKNGLEEDLNLVCKDPGSPINCNMNAADDMKMADMVLNQADDLQHDNPNVGHHENIPTCGEENKPLGASACAEIYKNKATQILFQQTKDTKAESLLPEVNRNVEPAALPLEATGDACINKRGLNNIVESTHLRRGEQIRNEVALNMSKNGQDRKIVKQREKSKKNDGLTKDDKDKPAAKAQKGHVAPKPFPTLKDFDIEEEEGSGGYGTVYRARRKEDQQVFAIKCPHPNAHSHHVINERKMLERFGGKNYVIKFECSFRSGDLECFVLEHVEHDRPEILKKDISLLELQWYGYCLFEALATLHKEGIVHRDVKPGNFLFSRKQKKGYLIDFNLANDLHQKFFKNCKSETLSCGKDTASQPSSNFAPVLHAKEAAADSKQPLLSKRKRSSRSPVGSAPKIDNKSRHGSQAADVSGVTSAKDPTSTKTPLVDRLKQPMLYKGRKELMNFLHEAMHSPNKNTPTAPVSQRKRIAAPVGSVDRKLFILTPMPLRSGGSTVPGSGMSNNKGHGKHRREGPCVGTKGFRAPEVLFRSFHQGCKVDVWSAGVTLLYLIIGKTPFVGDPEQNIKEIARLRGSEELWEVAKLHNCESSYPSELFDVKSLHSVDLRDWCAANTRRPEFFKMIPDSLFDLVDRCLAVNPRCRLTSKDALRHEFFAPCRESLRKPRMPRRSAVSDAACSSQGTALIAKS
ncbi:hypothetical protein ACP70R_019651 [Stipagrostis hirtigluma subsp. patula]